MHTLSNVNTRRGEIIPPCVRFAPEAFPEARSSQTGVSVRYEESSDKFWYVFRVSYGREDKTFDFLVEDGTYAYIAKKLVEKYVHGKRKRFLQPLIRNLLFVYTTKEKAEEYVNSTLALPYLSYYYNHFQVDKNGKNPPLTISTKEMSNFIIATCNSNEHLRFVEESQCHFKGGEIVKVTDGSFKGVVGRVARVAGQQRVIVELDGLCLIATAYIPTAFLMRL